MATATPSPNDPSGLVTNPPQTVVKIQGTARDDMNGQLGVVVQYNTDRARYLVHLASNQTTVAMKPENLIKATYIEQAQAQFQLLTKDPTVHRFLNQVRSKLPPGVTLQQVGMGVGAFMLALVYVLGLARTIMLLSFVMLGVMMVLPDLMEGADRQTILRNLPMRFQTLVRDQIPGGSYIADKPYAVAGVAVFMVAFFVKSMMPAAAAPPKSMAGAPAMPSRQLAQKTAEEYYKLGFDDATAQKEFGSSLPDVSAANNYDMLEDLPDYPMPPPTNRGMMGKVFSMSSAMSMMYLGKMAMDLGRDAGGGWSFDLFKNNLVTLEPWKLGMMAFSLYRLLNTILG
jgi:hypothetical protein